MHFDDLRYDKREQVARIAFNRPERRNALGDTSTHQLVQACQDALADPGVRVLVITGEGDHFCAGGDFQDIFDRGAAAGAPAWAERIRRGPNVLAQLLQSAAKPVLARIDGAAVGGGATIALACDLRIASTRAHFGFPFVRIGITPEFGCSYLLPRVVGLGRAMELLLLGASIDAATALRHGLVNQVVAPEDLDGATQQMVDRLLAQPPGAMAAIKALVHKGLQQDLPNQLEQEAQALGQAFTSQEHRDAVAAFLARRAG